MDNINVILADDHTLFRQGMCKLLDVLDGITVTHDAADGVELMQLLDEKGVRPDVILMDLDMPRLNGIEATAMIRRQYPLIKVIVLSVHDDEKFIARMIENGADGYLFKNAEITEVEKAIRDVIANGYYFNSSTVAAMRKSAVLKNKTLTFNNLVELTPRETEVLKLICEELTAAEIAQTLFISTRTVDGHRQNLLDKTGARNTAGLVIYAVKNNLLDIGF